MATGTVGDERTERKRELETAKNELEAAMGRYAAAEVAASAGGGPDSHPALADRRIRRTAACKTVVGRRMKCTGMRWTVAGANPVLWVRCARLSGWFDDYWDERLPQAA